MILVFFLFINKILELIVLEIMLDIKNMVIIRIYCLLRNLCGDYQLLFENEFSQVCFQVSF